MSGLVKRGKEEIAAKVQAVDSRFEAQRLVAYKCENREKYTEAIKKLWGDISNRAIVIGKFLIYAKETLPHGDYRAMIESDLPFGRSLAQVFRKIAEAVQQYEIREDALPRDYMACHMLLTLPSDAVETARSRGLISPKTTRKDAEAYRQEVMRPRILPRNHKALEKRRAKLLEQIEKLRAQLAKVEAEMIGELPVDNIDDGRIIEGVAVEIGGDGEVQGAGK